MRSDYNPGYQRAMQEPLLAPKGTNSYTGLLVELVEPDAETVFKSVDVRKHASSAISIDSRGNIYVNYISLKTRGTAVILHDDIARAFQHLRAWYRGDSLMSPLELLQTMSEWGVSH